MQEEGELGHRIELRESLSSDTGIWAMILAGSAGSRLWPSREEGWPPFLHPPAGEPSRLRQTVESLVQDIPYDRMMVACAPTHVVSIARECQGIPESNFVVEPLPRGSGPVGALMATLIAQKDPGSVILSLPADHALLELDDFSRSVQLGIAAARLGWTACLGLPYRQKGASYGYIERTGKRALVPGGRPIYQVERFWHAEDVAGESQGGNARRLLQHSGAFVSRVDTVLNDLRRLQPGLANLSGRLLEGWDTYDFERLSYFLWSTQPASSIERDILEHAERVAVVPPD